MTTTSVSSLSISELSNYPRFDGRDEAFADWYNAFQTTLEGDNYYLYVLAELIQGNPHGKLPNLIVLQAFVESDCAKKLFSNSELQGFATNLYNARQHFFFQGESVSPAVMSFSGAGGSWTPNQNADGVKQSPTTGDSSGFPQRTLERPLGFMKALIATESEEPVNHWWRSRLLSFDEETIRAMVTFYTNPPETLRKHDASAHELLKRCLDMKSIEIIRFLGASRHQRTGFQDANFLHLMVKLLERYNTVTPEGVKEARRKCYALIHSWNDYRGNFKAYFQDAQWYQIEAIKMRRRAAFLESNSAEREDGLDIKSFAKHLTAALAGTSSQIPNQGMWQMMGNLYYHKFLTTTDPKEAAKLLELLQAEGTDLAVKSSSQLYVRNSAIATAGFGNFESGTTTATVTGRNGSQTTSRRGNAGASMMAAQSITRADTFVGGSGGSTDPFDRFRQLQQQPSGPGTAVSLATDRTFLSDSQLQSLAAVVTETVRQQLSIDAGQRNAKESQSNTGQRKNQRSDAARAFQQKREADQRSRQAHDQALSGDSLGAGSGDVWCSWCAGHPRDQNIRAQAKTHTADTCERLREYKTMFPNFRSARKSDTRRTDSAERTPQSAAAPSVAAQTETRLRDGAHMAFAPPALDGRFEEVSSGDEEEFFGTCDYGTDEYAGVAVAMSEPDDECAHQLRRAGNLPGEEDECWSEMLNMTTDDVLEVLRDLNQGNENAIFYMTDLVLARVQACALASTESLVEVLSRKLLETYTLEELALAVSDKASFLTAVSGIEDSTKLFEVHAQFRQKLTALGDHPVSGISSTNPVGIVSAFGNNEVVQDSPKTDSDQQICSLSQDHDQDRSDETTKMQVVRVKDQVCYIPADLPLGSKIDHHPAVPDGRKVLCIGVEGLRLVVHSWQECGGSDHDVCQDSDEEDPSVMSILPWPRSDEGVLVIRHRNEHCVTVFAIMINQQNCVTQNAECSEYAIRFIPNNEQLQALDMLSIDPTHDMQFILREISEVTGHSETSLSVHCASLPGLGDQIRGSDTVSQISRICMLFHAKSAESGWSPFSSTKLSLDVATSDGNIGKLYVDPLDVDARSFVEVAWTTDPFCGFAPGFPFSYACNPYLMMEPGKYSAWRVYFQAYDPNAIAAFDLNEGQSTIDHVKDRLATLLGWSQYIDPDNQDYFYNGYIVPPGTSLRVFPFQSPGKFPSSSSAQISVPLQIEICTHFKVKEAGTRLRLGNLFVIALASNAAAAVGAECRKRARVDDSWMRTSYAEQQLAKEMRREEAQTYIKNACAEAACLRSVGQPVPNSSCLQVSLKESEDYELACLRQLEDEYRKDTGQSFESRQRRVELLLAQASVQFKLNGIHSQYLSLSVSQAGAHVDECQSRKKERLQLVIRRPDSVDSLTTLTMSNTLHDLYEAVFGSLAASFLNCGPRLVYNRRTVPNCDNTFLDQILLPNSQLSGVASSYFGEFRVEIPLNRGMPINKSDVEAESRQLVDLEVPQYSSGANIEQISDYTSPLIPAYLKPLYHDAVINSEFFLHDDLPIAHDLLRSSQYLTLQDCRDARDCLPQQGILCPVPPDGLCLWSSLDFLGYPARPLKLQIISLLESAPNTQITPYFTVRELIQDSYGLDITIVEERQRLVYLLQLLTFSLQPGEILPNTSWPNEAVLLLVAHQVTRPILLFSKDMNGPNKARLSGVYPCWSFKQPETFEAPISLLFGSSPDTQREPLLFGRYGTLQSRHVSLGTHFDPFLSVPYDFDPSDSDDRHVLCFEYPFAHHPATLKLSVWKAAFALGAMTVDICKSDAEDLDDNLDDDSAETVVLGITFPSLAQDGSFCGSSVTSPRIIEEGEFSVDDTQLMDELRVRFGCSSISSSALPTLHLLMPVYRALESQHATLRDEHTAAVAEIAYLRQTLRDLCKSVVFETVLASDLADRVSTDCVKGCFTGFPVCLQPDDLRPRFYPVGPVTMRCFLSHYDALAQEHATCQGHNAQLTAENECLRQTLASARNLICSEISFASAMLNELSDDCAQALVRTGFLTALRNTEKCAHVVEVADLDRRFTEVSEGYNALLLVNAELQLQQALLTDQVAALTTLNEKAAASHLDETEHLMDEIRSLQRSLREREFSHFSDPALASDEKPCIYQQYAQLRRDHDTLLVQLESFHQLRERDAVDSHKREAQLLQERDKAVNYHRICCQRLREANKAREALETLLVCKNADLDALRHRVTVLEGYHSNPQNRLADELGLFPFTVDPENPACFSADSSVLTQQLISVECELEMSRERERRLIQQLADVRVQNASLHASLRGDPFPHKSSASGLVLLEDNKPTLASLQVQLSGIRHVVDDIRSALPPVVLRPIRHAYVQTDALFAAARTQLKPRRSQTGPKLVPRTAPKVESLFTPPPTSPVDVSPVATRTRSGLLRKSAVPPSGIMKAGPSDQVMKQVLRFPAVLLNRSLYLRLFAHNDHQLLLERDCWNANIVADWIRTPDPSAFTDHVNQSTAILHRNWTLCQTVFRAMRAASVLTCSQASEFPQMHIPSPVTSPLSPFTNFRDSALNVSSDFYSTWSPQVETALESLSPHVSSLSSYLSSSLTSLFTSVSPAKPSQRERESGIDAPSAHLNARLASLLQENEPKVECSFCLKSYRKNIKDKAGTHTKENCFRHATWAAAVKSKRAARLSRENHLN